MKIIFKIAKTELQKLFYSPVAWLILIIFCFQCSLRFTDNFGETLRNQQLGYQQSGVTSSIFSVIVFGLFDSVISYLYLYIPLLTMGIMSQDINTGSIKLLYSSPVTNKQIIFGKYLALMLFGLVLVSVLGVFSLYAAVTIDNVDLPLIFCGILGVYLLICAYTAIGLFMSSITSYAVVAAMGTLGILALLNYLKGVGQDLEIVRDITYWIGISGRANTFVAGMITSEDVLYFLIVIGLFLSFTLIKLHSARQKTNRLTLIGKYFGVCVMGLVLGYFSTLPKLKSYLDVTNDKGNTLTKSSQDVVSKLTDGLTITTYVNMLEPNYWRALPVARKDDQSTFEQYIRFKPDIKLKYVYYYHRAQNDFLDAQYPKLNDKQRMDTTAKLNNFKFEIQEYNALVPKVDLAPEKFRLVRLFETDHGKKSFLRVFNDSQVLPSEREITAAFKRLTDDLPTVGFVTGQGERETSNTYDNGYNMVSQEITFRYALINQGFDFKTLSLDGTVPRAIRILVIADMRSSFNPQQLANLDDYIARGGNLIVMGEPGKQNVVNPVIERFGARLVPGTIVKHSKAFQPGLLVLKPTQAGMAFSTYLDAMGKYNYVLTMPGATGIELLKNNKFKTTILFASDSSRIISSLDDTIKRTTPGLIDGKLKTYPTVVTFSRQFKNKTQKILITGDADWLSNRELLGVRNDVKARNYNLINAVFYWLSDKLVPIDMTRPIPPDRYVSVGETGWLIANVFFRWIFSGLLLVAALLIWIRRRGR